MNVCASIFDTRAGFTLTAMVVTWVAIGLLTLIVLNLQLQLRRLGRPAASALATTTPFGGLVGRQVGDLLESDGVGPLPRLLLFVSSTCRSCAKVLAEVEAPSWTAPATVVWTDRPPTAALASRLGVRVTPFAVVVGTDGLITHAAPVNSLDRIAALTPLVNKGA